ncbi:MAG: hypothetical protein V4487_08780 [Chlamydiota bacterium]
MSVTLVRGICSGALNPIDELNSDIARLEADMQKNPQNAAIDEESINIDKQELSMEEESQKLFLAGKDPEKFNDLQDELLLLEKSREDKTGKTLLETPAQLNHALLSAMIADIRKTDPHFAPMGTEEGNEALIGLQQLIDRM